jgi:hypothetical protein
MVLEHIQHSIAQTAPLANFAVNKRQYPHNALQAHIGPWLEPNIYQSAYLAQQANIAILDQVYLLIALLAIIGLPQGPWTLLDAQSVLEDNIVFKKASIL